MNTPLRPDRKRNRLFGFDYSQGAFYFLTTCVKEMACVFGEVVKEEMHLNAYGQIAEQQWVWLLDQYPFVHAHAFVVMPNHVHALVEIRREEERDDFERVEDQEWVEDRESVEDQKCESNAWRTGPALSVRYPNVKSISQIMGAYKTTTSTRIRQAGMPNFAWHRSFHDHIVRNEKGFQNIKEYIENNPARWQDDTFRR